MDRPSGTVTFLFTDIVGSTRLWEARPQEMRQVLADHEQILRAVFEQHSGYVFATGGDSFSVAFTTPDEAVRAALDGQQALAEGPFEVVGGLPVRMAIHTGLTEERDGDYFGPPLNQVARMVAAAEGGQIVVSQTVANLVRYALPEGVRLRDLGKVQLKDVSVAEHLWEISTEARGARRRWPWYAAGGVAAILIGAALVVFLPSEDEDTTTTTQEAATTSTSTPTTAAATSESWLWMAEIEGEPLSLLADGDSVYVAYRTDQADNVASFDAYAGTLNWEYPTVGPVQQMFTDSAHRQLSGAYLYIVTTSWLELLHPNGELVPRCSTPLPFSDTGAAVSDRGLYVLSGSVLHQVRTDPGGSPCLEIRGENRTIGLAGYPDYGPSLAEDLVVAGDGLALYGLGASDLRGLWRYPQAGSLAVKGLLAEHRLASSVQGPIDENIVWVFSSDSLDSTIWNLIRIDPNAQPVPEVIGSIEVAARPDLITYRNYLGVIEPTGDLAFYDLDLQRIQWDPESGPVDVVTTTESHILVAATIEDQGSADTRVRWFQPGQAQAVHEEWVLGSRVMELATGSGLIHLLTEEGHLYTFAAVPGEQPRRDVFVTPPSPESIPDPTSVVRGFYEAVNSGEVRRTYQYLSAGATVNVGTDWSERLWVGTYRERYWEGHVNAGHVLNAQWTPTECSESPRSMGLPGHFVECEVTYTNDLFRAAGEPPATETHSYAVYNGLIYEFGVRYRIHLSLIDQIDAWLGETYPEEWGIRCSGLEPGGPFTGLECTQFRADHLDEWAASLQD